MKIFKAIALLFLAGTIIGSCKKDDNDADTNWTEALKQSTWAGEFQFTSGPYQGLQTFSLKLNNDNTLTWYQADAILPGVWSVSGNKITVTFSNGGVFSAELSKNSWSNFMVVNSNPRKIASLEKVSIPDPETLKTTIWKGKSFTGQDITITFLPGNKLRYFTSFALPDIPYTINGAGIKISSFLPATNSSDAYLVLINNFMKGYSTLTDFGGTSYYSWTGTKQ